MSEYIYTKKFNEIFDEFSTEINPNTKKRKRSEVSINSTYRHRIMLFLTQYMSTDENYQKEIKDISSDDVNIFLDNQGTDQKNYHRILTSFFKFTYEKEYTKDIVIGMKEPLKNTKEFKFISETDCQKIVRYINDRNNKFNNRLLLGLFYYTGLRLEHIINLTDGSFNNKYSSLWIKDKKGVRQHIPVRKELQLLLIENKDRLVKKIELVSPDYEIVNLSSNAVSTKVAKLSKDITGRKYSPSCYDKTFKKRALEVNCNPYYVSKLTFTGISSIARYIDEDVSLEQQKHIIESMK